MRRFVRRAGKKFFPLPLKTPVSCDIFQTAPIEYGLRGRVLKLSRMIDYGVVVLSQMAHQRCAMTTAPELAEATGLPAPTVSKVLKSLAHSDLVASQRGVRGGYTLSRAPADISVAEIIEALEGPVALTACVEASDAHCKVARLCPIRGGWEKVNAAIRQALEAVSLAELLATGFEVFEADGVPGETRLEETRGEA